MSPHKANPPSLELSLLGFLRQKPMYGYEIHKRFADRGGIGAVWHLKHGLLYAILEKLEALGYLSSAIDQSEPLRPKKIFSLTPAGDEAFLSWLANPVDHGRSIRQEFLLKLYFGRDQGVAFLEQLIHAQQRAALDWYQEVNKGLEFLEPQSYEAIVLEYRLQQIKAILEWLVICEKNMLPGQTHTTNPFDQ